MGGCGLLLPFPTPPISSALLPPAFTSLFSSPPHSPSLSLLLFLFSYTCLPTPPSSSLPLRHLSLSLSLPPLLSLRRGASNLRDGKQPGLYPYALMFQGCLAPTFRAVRGRVLGTDLGVWYHQLFNFALSNADIARQDTKVGTAGYSLLCFAA